MCGIVGGCVRDMAGPRPEQLRAALAQLRHRGPDTENQHIGRDIFLGHTRLAIIDLDPRANQPMHGWDCRIVFNGEIYNYRELRGELEGHGFRFSTTSDTEVLLAAYRHYGNDCLLRLEGMFAFAIWDERDRSVFVARDRFGEKPLFYYLDNEQFLFASEIAPLRSLLGGEKLTEDREALGLYFLLSYIPAPHAPYRGMAQLESGCWLRFSAETWSLTGARYYDLREAVSTRVHQDYAEVIEVLRARLGSSVRARLTASDVPVATFLSGGIDSSIITALAAQSTADSIAAYSIGFPNEPEFDESPYAIQVAQALPNLRHRVIPVSESTLEGFVDSTLFRLGEPFADSSLIPTAYLCSQVEEKVILGGDGADELFGGYGIYPAMMMSARLPRVIKRVLRSGNHCGNPHALRNPVVRAWNLFQSHLRDSAADEYLSWREYSSREDVHTLRFGTELVNGIRSRLAFLESGGLQAIQLADFLFNLPNDMLKKVDYASMFHSLEVRLPYLDSKLVETVLSLPDVYKIRHGQRKRILRDAFAALVPRPVLRRRKQGFLLPLRRWFRAGRLHEQLHALISQQTLFDRPLLHKRLGEHARGVADNSVFLWSLLVYLRWRQI